MLSKIYEKILNEDFDRSQYLKWKRNNILLRGVMDINKGLYNGNGAMLGDGLYLAFLSNKDLAVNYGKIYFVYGGKPKKPITFNTLNEFEIFKQRLIYKFLEEKGIRYSVSKFNELTDITTEIKKMGYDGVVIKGREVVNYEPNENELMFFENEDKLIDFYQYQINKDLIKEDEVNADNLRECIKSISLDDIALEQVNEDSPIYLDVLIDSCDGYEPSMVKFYIQVIKDFLLHPHLFLNEKIQRIGLGAKIIEKFVLEFGHAYLSKGRTLDNDGVNGMISKINNNNIEIIRGDLGIMLINKSIDKEDYEALKEFIQ